MTQTKEGDIIAEIKRRTSIFANEESQLNKQYYEKRIQLRETLLAGLGPESLQELMERNAYGPGLTKEEDMVAHLLADTLTTDDKKRCWVCPNKEDRSPSVAGINICRGHIHYALITRK